VIHPVDVMLAEADAAVERMKAAALEARRLQARAELARHMRTTARKMAAAPMEEAAAAISGEWMKAWSLDVGAYPAIAGQVAAFTQAFCRDARGSTTATQAAVRTAIADLEAGFSAIGTTLGDEMAFRSECAHGWWSRVVPLPEEMRRTPRAGRIPAPGEHEPFWSAGPQPHCL
jgi:hypothetical protein